MKGQMINMGDWNEQAAPNNNLTSATIRSSNLVTSSDQKSEEQNKHAHTKKQSK